MRRALALARRGLGLTSPNPCVGAVLVRGGKIIGEGWHRRAGEAHAEVAALRDVVGAVFNRDAISDRSRSRIQSAPTGVANRATLYVTLEPCCTHGRTPPCTAAIIAAGIRRVVVAATDQNPKHRGRGLPLLRRAGIRVDTGLLAEEATALNPAFNKWIVTGMPLVIAKAAFSLDGKMATHTGDSKWITSDTARKEAHRLRATVDAIMVGANTVIRDDPQLTLRHGVRGRQPWRVVMDASGRCPITARLFADNLRERTIVCTTARAPARWRRCLASRGIHVVIVPSNDRGVNLPAALRALGKLEVTSVLIEGGPSLLMAAFDAGVVDQVAFFYAPRVIAGAGMVATGTRWRGQWRRVGAGEMLFSGQRKE